MAPQSLGDWPYCCPACVRTGGDYHNSMCMTIPAAETEVVRPVPPLPHAPTPDPPLPAVPSARPPPAANVGGSADASLAAANDNFSRFRWLGAAPPSDSKCGRHSSPAPLSLAPTPGPPLPAVPPARPPPAANLGSSVDASLAAVNGNFSRFRWFGLAPPSVGAYCMHSSPARPPQVDCGQGRVEDTVDKESVPCAQGQGSGVPAQALSESEPDIASPLDPHDNGVRFSESEVGSPVVIPPDDVPVAHTSSSTPTAVPTPASSPVLSSREVVRSASSCRTSGCARHATDTEQGNHTVCCDTCSSTDGRFHTSLCDAADYALNVSSPSTVSTLVGTTNTNDFRPGWHNYSTSGGKPGPSPDLFAPFGVDVAAGSATRGLGLSDGDSNYGGLVGAPLTSLGDGKRELDGLQFAGQHTASALSGYDASVLSAGMAAKLNVPQQFYDEG